MPARELLAGGPHAEVTQGRFDRTVRSSAADGEPLFPTELERI
jgi:hypothetical protein